MKRTFSLFLALALLMALVPAAFAAEPGAEEAADTLNALGLFSGTGTNEDGTPIYDLDHAPTRNEAVTMLVRLLGKEAEAKAGTWDIPFTDVADWARPYVGYAYACGLTNGTGADTFGGGSLITVSQYLTFVLRAMGYDSSADFRWDAAWVLSDELGITHGEYDAASSFLRRDVAEISVSALKTRMKGAAFTLAEKLMGEGVFTEAQYRKAMGLTEEEAGEETVLPETMVSVPDPLEEDTAPTLLWLKEGERVRVSDSVSERNLDLWQGDAALINIPAEACMVQYVLEDITPDSEGEIEQCSTGWGGMVLSMHQINPGFWGERLLQSGHTYRITLQYLNALNEEIGKGSAYTYTYSPETLGAPYDPPADAHWTEDGLPAWTMPEDADRAAVMLSMEFDNPLRKENQESSQFGRMGFWVQSGDDEGSLRERIAEFMARGGEGAVYRFRVRLLYHHYAYRSASPWSEFSPYSPLDEFQELS